MIGHHFSNIVDEQQAMGGVNVDKYTVGTNEAYTTVQNFMKSHEVQALPYQMELSLSTFD